ncbi:hypothetical protein, partial [Nocardia anaemiae]|uniref:hypothetical protein n=1 Tax=Nocardia anaemiae TaxID=263910 RepID=UPI001C3FC8CE
GAGRGLDGLRRMRFDGSDARRAANVARKTRSVVAEFTLHVSWRSVRAGRWVSARSVDDMGGRTEDEVWRLPMI